jgi:predicted RNase H-like nuclease
MALTQQESKWLQDAAKHSAEASALLKVHTEQISGLFEQQRLHADKITTIQTRQDMCLRHHDPKLKAQHASVWALVVCSLVGFVWQVVNYLK